MVARRGAVIVEFALVVPFLALIVFGVIDFSRAYGQMNALDSAIREGARYGSKWKNYAVGDYRTAVKAKVQELRDHIRVQWSGPDQGLGGHRAVSTTSSSP